MKSADENLRKEAFEKVGTNYSIWKPFKDIKSYSEKIECCSTCGGKLNPDYTLIPISLDECAKIYGLSCKKCGCIYTNKQESVWKLLKDNSFAKAFTLNGDEVWNFTYLKHRKEKKDQENERRIRGLSLLSKIESSEIIFTVHFSNGKTKEVIIVNNSKDANTQNYIFHYASEDGREFLSAVFAKERKNHGEYNHLKYHVKGKPIYKKDKNKSFLPYLFCNELMIKPDGGYLASIKNNNYELVDILLYSPKAQKYEIMRVTHCVNDDCCFADISRYRTFVHKYGNPKIDIFPEKTYGSCGNHMFLNEESIIRCYGYTVNQKDNLSSKERQDLLAEMIDLNILNANKIANFLDFLININARYNVAKSKWQEDKEFVEDYEPKPQRFLIMKE